MAAKMGRPPIGESVKDKQYRLRMSAEEWAKLEYCCQMTGLNKAEVFRLGIDKVYQEVQKNKTIKQSPESQILIVL